MKGIKTMSRKSNTKKASELRSSVTNSLEVLNDFTPILKRKETIEELKRLHRQLTGKHSNNAHFNSMFRYFMGKYPRNASKADLSAFNSKFAKFLKLTT